MRISILLCVLLLSACTAFGTKSKVPHRHHVHSIDLKPNRYNVAFLIMDGVYNTELTAPFDIFQHTIFREGIKSMNVFTVAKTKEPITTFEKMRILPDFNYLTDELPKIDILVVPSAEHHLDTDLEDEAMINFVKKVDQEAMYMTSHCDGAFVLAKAGPKVWPEVWLSIGI